MPGPIATAAEPSLVTVVIPALIALAGVLLTALIGFLQWRKAQSVTKELEAEKLAHQRDLLAWEKEKLALTWEVDRERAAETAKADRLRDLREAHRAAQEKTRASRRESSTDAELAQEYRSTLAEQLKAVQILDMSRPLDLEKVYVQLTVREEAGQFAREREVRQLAEGDPREHMVRPGPDKPTMTVHPDEALRRHQRIVVLGDPGSGKTTMLKHLALRAAQTGTELPIYVELRKFVDSGIDDLLTYVIHVLAEDYRFDGAGPFLEESFGSHRALLMLDGLDEVLGGASAEASAAVYDRIVADIARVAVRHPTLPIAVTCRRAGWRPGLASFTTLEVVDFTWEQIGQFIDNWFDAQPGRARQLRQALSDNLRMQALATNPLMLSLIAIVFERELELPERRAELYNRCAEVMLREWDSHRSIRRFARFTTDRKRDLLQEVAWRFHLDGKRYFPEAALLDVIADYLPTIGIAAGENKAILDEIAAQYGLLKEQAHGWYGFLHLTMQEYFAAVSAAARGGERFDHVVRHRHDPWWEEVLVLQAGLVPDATGLLREVLGWRGRKRRTDDVLNSDLMLAAQCLVGTPRIEDTSLRAKIIDELRGVVIEGPSSFHRGRAATALVGIGTPESSSVARAMVFDLRLPDEVRAAVASALCGLPDEQTRRDVDRLLAEGPDTHGANVIEAVLRAIRVAGLSTHTARVERLLSADMPEMLRTAAVTAIASTGDRSMAHVFRRMLAEEPEDQSRSDLQDALVEAVAELEGPECLPLLFSLLDERSFFWAGLAGAIVKIGERAGVARLASRIGDRDRLFHDQRIAEALADADSGQLVELAGDVVRNQDLDWTVKWMYVRSMDRAGVARRYFEELRASGDLDPLTRLAVATALVNRGDSSLSAELSRAVALDLIPLEINSTMGRSTYIRNSVTVVWVCRALRTVGDRSVLPYLLDRAESVAIGHRTSFGSAVVKAALVLGDDDVRLRVLENHVGRTREATYYFADLSESTRDARIAQWIRRTTADHPPSTSGHAFKAVHAICRRGRFRIFPDGRVEHLPS